jgi:hypothetical protein
MIRLLCMRPGAAVAWGVSRVTHVAYLGEPELHTDKPSPARPRSMSPTNTSRLS